MKNLTTAGDITYFTISGDIYGIDATDGSAVHCHDAESPAERVDYVDMCDILELSDIDQTEDYDEYSTIWHFDGFDVLAQGSEFYIEEHCYMNIPTGSVDTFSNWVTEGFIPDETELLVRVTKDSSGDWAEVA